MKTIIVREFQPCIEDAKGLKEIDGRTFRECTYSEAEMIRIAKEPQNKIFIAEMEEKMVGFISLLQVQTLHYKGLWVDLIAVDPTYQNKGIASLLLNHGKQYGEALQVDFVSGLVAKDNESSGKAFKKQKFTPLDKDYQLHIYDNKVKNSEED